MRRSVGQPDTLGPVNPRTPGARPGHRARRRPDPRAPYDLAVAINRQVAAGALGTVPRTSADWFSAAAEAGMIAAKPAAVLAPPDGPHHVLVQLCMDADPDDVTAIVAAALSGYEEYVRQVAYWTAADARRDVAQRRHLRGRSGRRSCTS